MNTIISLLRTPKHELKEFKLIKLIYLSPFVLSKAILWGFGTVDFGALVDVITSMSIGLRHATSTCKHKINRPGNCPIKSLKITEITQKVNDKLTSLT